MNTQRIFTAVCIIVCISFFALSRTESATEETTFEFTTTSGRTDTSAAEEPLKKGTSGEPKSDGKGTSSTRSKKDGMNKAPVDNTRTDKNPELAPGTNTLESKKSPAQPYH